MDYFLKVHVVILDSLFTGNTRLEDFRYDNEEVTTAIYESMKTITFTGIRGRMSFDSNGDPLGLVQIDRVQSSCYPFRGK